MNESRKPETRSSAGVPAPGGPGDFRPAASLAVLRRRADILARTRAFFASRGVLEVETPLAGAGVVVETHIDPVPCVIDPGAGARPSHYLHASPEGCMKRLLAAGCGPIYQLARAFRQGERGRLHNPEFTMLEWYRPGFDFHQLMGEVEELVGGLLAITGFERRTYAEVFEAALGIDPHTAGVRELAELAHRRGVPRPAGFGGETRDGWLDLLLSFCVEPDLGGKRPTFVFDYPATQAAFGRVRRGRPPVAERFELYVDGIELANGYQEETDPGEIRRRIDAAAKERERRGKRALPPDGRFLSAARAGLPAGSGVALGFDRLVLLAVGATTIDEVLAFPHDRV